MNRIEDLNARRAVHQLAKELESYLTETTDGRDGLLTLGDGSQWQYFNASNYWRAITGKHAGKFSHVPSRNDDLPLTVGELEGVRAVKAFGTTTGPLFDGGAPEGSKP